MKRLQYLLTHSYYAKVLAVRKVTTNKGKKTPGVGGDLWSTPVAKMRGVLTLTDKGYKANCTTNGLLCLEPQGFFYYSGYIIWAGCPFTNIA